MERFWKIIENISPDELGKFLDGCVEGGQVFACFLGNSDDDCEESYTRCSIATVLRAGRFDKFMSRIDRCFVSWKIYASRSAVFSYKGTNFVL